MISLLYRSNAETVSLASSTASISTFLSSTSTPPKDEPQTLSYKKLKDEEPQLSSDEPPRYSEITRDLILESVDLSEHRSYESENEIPKEFDKVDLV